MSLIVLDSSLITNSNAKTHDFTTEFTYPIQVNNGDYELALLKVNLWYSFHNVSSSLSNNTFQYTNNTAQTRTVTFPNGNYTIVQLNNYLAAYMTNQGDTVSIVIEPNYSTLKTKITLSNAYTLDFTTSDFSLLLGWNKLVYNFAGTQEGQNPANINRDINSLLIRCDIITGSYKNGLLSDTMLSFVPNVPPGSNIEVEPTHLIYLPLNIPSNIYRIRMYITDNLGREVDLNGEPVTYLLHLRRKSDFSYPNIKNF